MKKIVKVLALTLVCALSILALVACGDGVTVNEDLAAAETKLKAKGYEGGILTGAAIAEQAEMLPMFGITDISKINKLLSYDLESDDEVHSVMMAEFATEEDAKAAYNVADEALKTMIAGIKDGIAQAKQALSGLSGAAKEEAEAMIAEMEQSLNLVWGISGKVIFMGDKQGCADTL